MHLLGTPIEESYACMATSLFAAARTRTGKGMRGGTRIYKIFMAYPVNMPEMYEMGTPL